MSNGHKPQTNRHFGAVRDHWTDPPHDPRPTPAGPPGTPPSASDEYFEGLTYRRAKNAFWLGVASLFCFGPFTGIPAVFVGAQALSDIDASRGRLVGRRAAWEGVVLGAVGSVAGTGIYWHLLWQAIH